MIKLKDILIETPESSVKTVFGNIVFGDDNKIVRLQNKTGKEQNTKKEEKIKQLLITWLSGGYDSVTPTEIYKYHKLFKVASEEFPGIFNPMTPNGTSLYRGLREIPKKLKIKLKKVDKLEWEKINIGGNYYFKYKNPVRYTPELQIQSWSSNPKVAKNFSKGSVVLITKQNEEFLFNQKLLKLIYGEDESEVIHFGKKYKEYVYITISEWAYFMIMNDKTF